MSSDANKEAARRLTQEYNEFKEAGRLEKNKLYCLCSKISAKISEFDRLLGTAERQRAALMFRRPRTREGQFQLNCVADDINVLTSNLQRLRGEKQDVEAEIREIQSDVTAARTKLARDLKKLKEERDAGKGGTAT